MDGTTTAAGVGVGYAIAGIFGAAMVVVIIFLLARHKKNKKELK